MIRDHDRSYYIGASDVGKVMGKWDTKTFEKWWRVKQGFDRETFTNDAMAAGTFYERRILESLGLNLEYDRQIIDGRLRVNLDGSNDLFIFECKTHSAEKEFKVSAQYRNQVNVQMYASGIRQAYIVSYGLKEEDYKNFYNPIDEERRHLWKVEYDEKWIKEKFLPRYEYLAQCLDEGRYPDGSRFR